MSIKSVLGGFDVDNYRPNFIVTFSVDNQQASIRLYMWLKLIDEYIYVTTLCTDKKELYPRDVNKLVRRWLNDYQVKKILNDPVTLMLMEVFNILPIGGASREN